MVWQKDKSWLRDNKEVRSNAATGICVLMTWKTTWEKISNEWKGVWCLWLTITLLIKPYFMMRSQQPPWEEVWLVGGSKPRWLWSLLSTGSPPWSSRPQNPWSARWWRWGKYDVVECEWFCDFKDHGHAGHVSPEEEDNKNASNDQRDPQEDWKTWGGKIWVLHFMMNKLDWRKMFFRSWI